MFVFACPIIAGSQCRLVALRTNIWPPNLNSGICAVVSNIICESTRKDGVKKYA